MSTEDVIVIILAGMGIVFLCFFLICLGGYVLGKIKELKDND